MNDIKRLNALNYARSELKSELNNKMDKTMNYGKIEVLQRIINLLQ